MLTLRRHSSHSLNHIISLTLVSSSHHLQSLPNPTFPSPPITTLPCFNPPPFSSPLSKHLFSSQTNQTPLHNFTRDGNFDETPSQNIHICPGCGVHLQSFDPKKPGFYITPTVKNPDYKLPISKRFVLYENELPNSIKKGFFNDFMDPQNPILDNKLNPTLNPKLADKPVVCARCHSLRHYGNVKDVSLENLLPDFDFDHTVGRRLATASGVRSVVMMVVDGSDFDGSFPRRVAKLVSTTIDENMSAWKEGKSGNVPRMVLVLSKLDLLPSSVSPTRLEHWVRQRAREGGASKLTSLHMVSAVRDWGVKDLIDDVVRLAGPRGNVWAVGAQNAGKSTLINAIGKHVSENGTGSYVTEAPVPGTTLGIIRLEGVLPGNTKLFDTPGLLHPYHISTRLTREEQKLVQISKELKPRTYRIKVGHTIHIAGLMRLDVEELSVDSIYVTVWASPLLPLHMGKTENADRMLLEHFGQQLQPPVGENRIEELGKWVKREFHVSGKSWDTSCVDIAAAGVGWFGIGLKGDATLSAWTYDGIEVVLRNTLLPDRAQKFEVTGFTTSKIVSMADKTVNKSKKPKREEKQRKTDTSAGNVEAVLQKSN